MSRNLFIKNPITENHEKANSAMLRFTRVWLNQRIGGKANGKPET